MPRTQITGTLIEDGSIKRPDINTSISGQSLITKLLTTGGYINMSQSGADVGTGDVTISLNTTNLVTGVNGRKGNVTLTGQDVTDALGYVPLSGGGWNGNISLNVPSNPPGQQNINIFVSDGLITNVTFN